MTMRVKWKEKAVMCGGDNHHEHRPIPMIFERKGRGIRNGAIFRCSICNGRKFVWRTNVLGDTTLRWKHKPVGRDLDERRESSRVAWVVLVGLLLLTITYWVIQPKLPELLELPELLISNLLDVLDIRLHQTDEISPTPTPVIILPSWEWEKVVIVAEPVDPITKTPKKCFCICDKVDMKLTNPSESAKYISVINRPVREPERILYQGWLEPGTHYLSTLRHTEFQLKGFVGTDLLRVDVKESGRSTRGNWVLLHVFDCGRL